LPSILDDIIEYKIEEVKVARRSAPLADVEQRAAATPPPRGFAAALDRAAETGVGLIAEVKKASPSKGLIRADFDPASIARAYERGGAACLSVLTDGPGFQGAPEHLAEARAAVALPCLRKDFMIDPYQVAEARAWGADCILLIMACLSDAQARELEDAADRFGLDVLVETHTAEELDRALRLRSRLIGVNNRDLNSFETRLETTFELLARAPADAAVVSESGIAGPADIERLVEGGVRRVLVGESLMRRPDVAEAAAELLGPFRPRKDG